MPVTATDPYRSYLRRLLAWALLPLLGAVLLNALVDPLRLLDYAGLRGWTLNKPALRDQERLFKPFAVVRQRPEVVLLGSSRSNHALDPDHPAFAGQRAYNLSLSGTNVTEMRQMFEHALAQGALQRAVLELDIGFFSASAQGSSGGFAYADTVSAHHPWQRRLRALQTAWSWDTLALSWQTLRGQRTGWEYTDTGRQGDRVFENRIATYGGVRNTVEGYMQRLLPAEQQLAAAWDASGVPADQLPGMQDLRALLDLARERGVQVAIYLSPVHAIDACATRAIFGADRLEAWRAALVQLRDEQARKSAGRFIVPLWDFSGFNSVTSEPLPQTGDPRARMANFWDQSHYRKQVGDWVLDRIFGLQGAGATVPADFGVRLEAQNLAGHFAFERNAADNYAIGHTEVTRFVAGLTHGSNHQSGGQ